MSQTKTIIETQDAGEARTVKCAKCSRSAKEYPIHDGTMMEGGSADADRVCFIEDLSEGQMYALVHTEWDTEQ